MDRAESARKGQKLAGSWWAVTALESYLLSSTFYYARRRTTNIHIKLPRYVIRVIPAELLIFVYQPTRLAGVPG